MRTGKVRPYHHQNGSETSLHAQAGQTSCCFEICILRLQKGSCIRTKETYLSEVSIDIKILKVSFDWALTTVLPLRLQYLAIRGNVCRSTMIDRMRASILRIKAETGSVSRSKTGAEEACTRFVAAQQLQEAFSTDPVSIFSFERSFNSSWRWD